MSQSQVDKAVRLAAQCDLNIVVAGEHMFRGNWMQRTCGEDTDRSDLDLVGLQQEMIERIYATGVPTVVVLVTGRPLSVEWIADNVPALLNAWEPGMYGGQAVADILYANDNASLCGTDSDDIQS